MGKWMGNKAVTLPQVDWILNHKKSHYSSKSNFFLRHGMNVLGPAYFE